MFYYMDGYDSITDFVFDAPFQHTVTNGQSASVFNIPSITTTPVTPIPAHTLTWGGITPDTPYKLTYDNTSNPTQLNVPAIDHCQDSGTFSYSITVAAFDST